MFSSSTKRLMPPAELRAALATLLKEYPELNELTRAPSGTPESADLDLEFATHDGEKIYAMVQIPLPRGSGTLYVSQKPGRSPKRLVRELEGIVGFGITHIVCCIPEEDLEEVYDDPAFVHEARARFGDRPRMCEILDSAVPVDEPLFDSHVALTDEALEGGGKVLVHCGAGCGRAGMFASCLLVRRGMAPHEAIRSYWRKRGCGPETPGQVAYVQRYAQRL